MLKTCNNRLAEEAGVVTILSSNTLDTTMYGSDQKASIEPDALRQLLKDIRAWSLRWEPVRKC